MSEALFAGFDWQSVATFDPAAHDFVILRNETGWRLGGQRDGRWVEIVDAQDYPLTIGEPTEYAIVPDERISDFDFG